MCYRNNCEEECNELKEKYCLFRITEEQQKLIAEIKNNSCKNCGEHIIKARYRGEKVKLCTNCGIAMDGVNIVRKCLVNSKKAS